MSPYTWYRMGISQWELKVYLSRHLSQQCQLGNLTMRIESYSLLHIITHSTTSRNLTMRIESCLPSLTSCPAFPESHNENWKYVWNKNHRQKHSEESHNENWKETLDVVSVLTSSFNVLTSLFKVPISLFKVLKSSLRDFTSSQSLFWFSQSFFMLSSSESSLFSISPMPR